MHHTNYSSNLFSIENKIIAIFGSTGILGTTLSYYLASQGAHLILMGRNAEKTEKLSTAIQNSGGSSTVVVNDITNEESLDASVQTIEKTFGHVDILINMAGGNMAGATIQPNEDFFNFNTQSLKDIFDLNYFGTVVSIKKLFPLLLKSDHASIINISSMAASRPMTRVMGYASAKAAIDNITKWLAIECCSKYGDKIRVNAVAPGFFLTEQNRELLTTSDKKLTERGNQIVNHTPMKRFGNPDELCGVIHWLSSTASQFVTGTIIPVDGGFDAYAGV
ncbi:SDR family oxidoreductase [Aquimarina sp. U1-2]|uniref:SDR family oxidoreductase n=1 Tax=Aquimarina sp. U1-2 TaxID=2823141 RepID=UPI001AECC38B|nr:SDR family oxidoreductase [Aquimarina sp. U1-2]MBP2832905.1 SDR family oxidoreductase [Aquimarina sp. U1-2]